MRKDFYFFILILFSLGARAQIVPSNYRYYVDEGRKLIVCNELPTSGQISGSPVQIQFDGKIFTFPGDVTALNVGVKYTITKEGTPYTLYFTQLPIVNLDVANPNNINTEEEIAGGISLADQEHAPVNSKMAIRIRGNSSAFFPKKNYRVQFKDDAGKNKDVSILGLRTDKRWLFFGMWNEEIRSTNNVSHNLWIDMHKLSYASSEPSAISSIRTKYVEAFMNKSYKGVYLIGEDMDRKQLQLKKNDGDVTKGELYKADDWSLSVIFAGIGVAKPAPGTEEWQSWQFDYPDTRNWDNFYKFLQDVIQSPDDVFKNTIFSNIKEESLIDYFIYVNVMLAEDNLGRNFFLAKYDAGQPMFFVPWDLDATWGYLGNGTRTNLTEGERTTDLFKRLMRLNPNGFKNKLASRYFSLRQNILTESGLKGRFLNNYNLLNANLVYERDVAVSGDQYGGADRSGGLSYINNFISKRLTWLDNYFCPMLDGGNCSGAPNCALDITASASNTSPACSASVTLTSNCTGADCAGVTYTWTGNGINLSGTSVNITAPGVNGAYIYTVKASKSGCADKTATVTLNISNCAPPAGNDPFSACIEAENSNGNGPITNDPNASNGGTRGDKNNYNHYVDYAINDVKATGTHQVKLRYYSNGAAQASISVNGNVSIASVNFPPTNSWNIVWREETFNVTLNQGNNTLRIQGLPGNSIRQDQICVTGAGGGGGQNPQEPTCNFSIAPTANKATYSPQEQINFIANCSGGDCGSVAFTWTGNGANTTGATANINAPLAPGTYTYTLTASKSGCANKTTNVTIQVANSQPTCAFDITASASNTSPACSANVTLSTNCTGADCSGVTYTWTGNGINQTGSSISIAAPGANGAYIYTAKASKNGCTDKTATVTLNITNCSPPVGNDPFSACLEAENQSGNGAITGDPNASNGNTRGDKDNYNHYVDYAINGVKATGTHQVKIRYYANGAAQASFSVNGNVVQASVNFPPTYSWNIVWREEIFDVTLNQGNNVLRIQGLPGYSIRQDKICVTGPGGSGGGGGQNPQEPTCAFNISTNASNTSPACSSAVTLSAACTGADCSGLTYNWTGNGINQSGSTVNINAPGANGSYVYTVKASKTGCADKTATVTLNITTCTAPIGNGPFNACLEAENSSGSGPVTDDPNASNGKTRGDKNNYNHYVDYAVNNVLAAGTYQLKLRYAANANPNIAIAVNGSTVVASTTLPATYSWNIVFREEIVNVTLAAGNNTVRILGLNGPSIRQDKICVTGTAPSNIRMGAVESVSATAAQDQQLNIFPNPASGTFNAKFTLSETTGKLTITDVKGRVWHSANVKGKGLHEEKIVMPNAPAGVYLMQIKSGEMMEVKKFLIAQ